MLRTVAVYDVRTFTAVFHMYVSPPNKRMELFVGLNVLHIHRVLFESVCTHVYANPQNKMV